MAALTEAQKRSFNWQMTEIMSANKEELKKQGLDITAKLKLLQGKAAASEKAEEEQLKAMAEVKAKTAQSVKMTTEDIRPGFGPVGCHSGNLGQRPYALPKTQENAGIHVQSGLKGRKKGQNPVNTPKIAGYKGSNQGYKACNPG
ncbi:hypothetical protein HY768_02515 [candidate division TA06 bacterium]|uniref:Uncharacterized protein n=1 Tax=candidate division TA06 bacterium TaxID=2250710 RepID=A0A933MHI5_UNCT6|nr:hypothetical protein [candidate division TA06 bacterium]